MEVLLFFVSVGIFFVVMFFREAILAKRKEKEFVISLERDFGALPGREYSPERYARIGRFYEKHRRSGQIDDITWNDLDMDTIFKRMNNTLSASGEEYLYYTLRTPKKSAEELSHFEETVIWFLSHVPERVQVQRLMNELGYMGKFSLYDYIDNLDYLGERSNAKHYAGNLLFIPFLCLLPISFPLGIVGVSALAVYNIVSYFREKNEIDPYVTSFSYIMRLLLVCGGLVKIDIPVLAEQWREIELHRKQLGGIKRGSFWVFTGGRSAGTGNPLDLIMDYMRMVFHVDLMKFNSMLAHLKKHTADVDALIEHVGYVETAIAVGAFRMSLHGEFCVPGVGESEKLILEDAWYPTLNCPVKNSIAAERGVLLTGSNASGKSTFLKTVAVNCVLAQTIHTCTAGSCAMPFMRVYSSMALHDNLKGGESYYIVEIKALKRILDAASEGDFRVLCFVDEVLRGTNTVERIAASTQILKSLTGSKILCFAATHDIEMADLLKDDYDNYHFEEEIAEGDVHFNYKLLTGKATTRNAIKLLEIMGYDEKIIEKALKQAERFTATGVWQLESS